MPGSGSTDEGASHSNAPSNLAAQRPSAPSSPGPGFSRPAAAANALRRASVQPVPSSASDGGAGSPFSGSGSGAAARVFPRSLTHDVAHGGHGFASPVSPVQGRRASVAARAGRQQGDAEAGEGEARFAGASGFNLEGRSYRFQTATHDGTQLGRSYTATSGTIRDSTAQLAGMALMSDDDESNSSRIEERDEGEAEGLAPARLDGLSSSAGGKSGSYLSSERGPSNLSRVMASSAGTSPATVRAVGSNEGSPRDADATPKAQRSPVSSQNKTVPPQAPPVETTPLLAGASERIGRDPQIASSQDAQKRHRSTSTSGSSRSGGDIVRALRGDARKLVQSPGAVSGLSVPASAAFNDAVVANESGFSLRGSNSGSASGVRNVYGSGALAQASAEAEAAGGSGIEVPRAGGDGDGSRISLPPPGPNYQVHWALPDDTDYDTEDRPLSAAWGFVPAALRPGKGARPLRAGFSPSAYVRSGRDSLSKLTWSDVMEAGKEPVRCLPAVILGLLLNVLDGVSYGLIIFPNSYPIFSDFGGDGVSMFFVTCVISQLVYSLGGSIFRGGNASMMIEVVPFFHILVQGILDELGDSDPAAVISTTIVSFALSSIFAGIVFLILGWFRLGLLIGFFPRHILVGCIGGVGVFLIETGLEVSSQLRSEEGFQWNLESWHYLTQSWDMVAHWAPALGLAILLRVITARYHQPLIFPTYFLVIPVIFYIFVVGAGRQSVDSLREHGWVFDIGNAGDVPFWHFYTYFDLRKTSFRALWSTMPTQLALTFFSILHVPLNVPALAISVNEDNLDTDRELVAHGISNILAGLAGSVPNYLCYVNSVLFYRVGGGSRTSGVMLAGGTFAILLAGPGAIGYLPIVVVGALIFVLGIDLVKEAVWDTVGRVNGWEYFTIWVILATMTYYDFVVGILVGVILACLFFVVQTSRRPCIKSILDGTVARSTVRRHTTQRQFLDAVGSQLQLLKLNGFLYFANISSVEELIRRALDIATWQHTPIRFMMVDFSLVSGIDFSAAEAFTRIQRLLETKGVVLVFCGLTPESDVGAALRAVDMWPEVFQNLNEALTWTENSLLRGMYASNLSAGKQFSQASLAAGGGLDVPDKKRQPAFVLDETVENSPRRHHLHQAALEATKGSSSAMAAVRRSAGVADGGTAGDRQTSAPRSQPLALLLVTFSAYAGPDADEALFAELASYFRPMHAAEGETLWEQGDESDSLYLIEAGILNVRYDFEEGFELNERVLAGTLAGELTFLSREPRNTTAYVELDCTLHRIDRASMKALEQKAPAVFGAFVQMLLRATSEEQSQLMSYLVSRLS